MYKRREEATAVLTTLKEAFYSAALGHGYAVEFLVTGSYAKGTQVWRAADDTVDDDVDILVIFPGCQPRTGSAEYLSVVLKAAYAAREASGAHSVTLTPPSITVGYPRHHLRFDLLPALRSEKEGYFFVPNGDGWVLSPNEKELDWMEEMKQTEESLLETILWLKQKNQQEGWNLCSYVCELVVLSMFKEGLYTHDFEENNHRALGYLRDSLMLGLQHPFTGREILHPISRNIVHSAADADRLCLIASLDRALEKFDLAAEPCYAPSTTRQLGALLSGLFLCCARPRPHKRKQISTHITGAMTVQGPRRTG